MLPAPGFLWRLIHPCSSQIITSKSQLVEPTRLSIDACVEVIILLLAISVGDIGVILILHHTKTKEFGIVSLAISNQHYYANPYTVADILLIITSVISGLSVLEVIIRFFIIGRRVLRFPIDILDAIFVFGTFIAVIWCSVAKLDPLVSDVVLLAGFLRLIRLPRLCCGLTSVESAQYRATITFYQQDESFHQHSLNILQHRLELSEIELQQLRQFVHTTQGPGSQLCSSRDYSEGSGTTKYYWNGAEHETLGLRLQNLRKVPLSEEFEGDGLTSEVTSASLGEENPAFEGGCGTNTDDACRRLEQCGMWVQNCTTDTIESQP
uniref:Ion_trans domain-containing protein n=1 Tax=Mesocestoides corti TaxID=53468 RepID=A0A5K3EM72_MESCO